MATKNVKKPAAKAAPPPKKKAPARKPVAKKELTDEGNQEELKGSCPGCGADAPDGSKFCPECGADMKKDLNDEGNQEELKDEAPDATDDAGDGAWEEEKEDHADPNSEQPVGPYVPKYYAKVLAKLHRHAKAEQEFIDKELGGSDLDHPPGIEDLTKYKVKMVDPRMSHLKGLLDNHYDHPDGHTDDDHMDAVTKAVEAEENGPFPGEGESSAVAGGEFPEADKAEPYAGDETPAEEGEEHGVETDVAQDAMEESPDAFSGDKTPDEEGAEDAALDDAAAQDKGEGADDYDATDESTEEILERYRNPKSGKVFVRKRLAKRNADGVLVVECKSAPGTVVMKSAARVVKKGMLKKSHFDVVARAGDHMYHLAKSAEIPLHHKAGLQFHSDRLGELAKELDSADIGDDEEKDLDNTGNPAELAAGKHGPNEGQIIVNSSGTAGKVKGVLKERKPARDIKVGDRLLRYGSWLKVVRIAPNEQRQSNALDFWLEGSGTPVSWKPDQEVEVKSLHRSVRKADESGAALGTDDIISEQKDDDDAFIEEKAGENDIICPKCDGSGQVQSREGPGGRAIPCPKCGGLGSIGTKTKADETGAALGTEEVMSEQKDLDDDEIGDDVDKDLTDEGNPAEMAAGKHGPNEGQIIVSTSGTAGKVKRGQRQVRKADEDGAALGTDDVMAEQKDMDDEGDPEMIKDLDDWGNPEEMKDEDDDLVEEKGEGGPDDYTVDEADLDDEDAVTKADETGAALGTVDIVSNQKGRNPLNRRLTAQEMKQMRELKAIMADLHKELSFN